MLHFIIQKMNCTLNITLFIQITNANEYILFKQEKKKAMVKNYLCFL